MNDPLAQKKAAAIRRQQQRKLRIRTIRGSVAALGASLVIAFSTAVIHRPAGAAETVTVTNRQVATSTAGTTSSTDLGTTTTESSGTTTSQPEQLVTSQS